MVHEISHVNILPLDSTYLTGMKEYTYEYWSNLKATIFISVDSREIDLTV